MTSPSRPAYLHHSTPRAASIAAMRWSLGSTSSRYACGWREKSVQLGMLTTRVPIPSACSACRASSAMLTSEPVAIRTARSSPSASAST